MKKLVLSIVVAAFAIAVQAGDTPACAEKAGAGCCPAKNAATAAKAECPMAKQAKITGKTAGQCKSCKIASKNGSNKQALKSPKAVADARK